MLPVSNACEVILKGVEELPLASRLTWALRNAAVGNSSGRGRKRGALIYHFVVNIFMLSTLGFLPPSMKLPI